jgi:hypothetical protein
MVAGNRRTDKSEADGPENQQRAEDGGTLQRLRSKNFTATSITLPG